MVIGVIVDYHVSVPFQPHGVTDDLAVQSIRPVITVDCYRRGNRQDRAGHLAACIAVDPDLTTIAGWHVEQKTFIISAGRCIQPVFQVTVPPHTSGGEEKGHIIAVDMAGGAKIDPTATVDVDHHVIAGQITAIEPEFTASDQELDTVSNDRSPIKTPTVSEAVCTWPEVSFADVRSGRCIPIGVDPAKTAWMIDQEKIGCIVGC